MTDRTNKKTDELYRSAQERINVLEQEKQELQELNEQLEMENYALKRKVSSYNQDDLGNNRHTYHINKRVYRNVCCICMLSMFKDLFGCVCRWHTDGAVTEAAKGVT